jgi:hypothetical protein
VLLDRRRRTAGRSRLFFGDAILADRRSLLAVDEEEVVPLDADEIDDP